MAGLWDGGPGSEETAVGNAQMSVMPNPAATAAEVQYTVESLSEFDGGTIKLYGLDGRLIESHQVHEAQGRVNFDLSGFASGTYVLVFFNEGLRMGQQILIKE